MADLKKLKDAVAQAGARVARAQLNLELAERDLERTRNAFFKRENNPQLFDVRLMANGTNKIAVIKAIREVTNMGLKESKDITDFAGWNIDSRAFIKTNVSSEEAELIRKAIAAAGGTVAVEEVKA